MTQVARQAHERSGRARLKARQRGVDKEFVEINEDLIEEALLRSQAGELETLLTAIEAYRMCARTAQRLERSRRCNPQRNQVTACAEYCESVLRDYTATGRLRKFRYPDKDFGCAQVSLQMEW